MHNGCCRSDSGKLIADHHYPRDTYVTHDGRIASCSLLNSSTYCSSHRVCDFRYSFTRQHYEIKRKCIDFKCVQKRSKIRLSLTHCLWNSLPPDVTSHPTLTVFHNRLKTSLVSIIFISTCFRFCTLPLSPPKGAQKRKTAVFDIKSHFF